MNMPRRIMAILFATILSISLVVPVFALTNADDAEEKEDITYSWEKEDNEWVCTDEAGEPVTGWAIKDNNRYFLNKDGKIKTGWVKDKGNWYYLYTEKDDVKKDQIGTLATDTWIDNYYVDKNGIQKKTKK